MIRNLDSADRLSVEPSPVDTVNSAKYRRKRVCFKNQALSSPQHGRHAAKTVRRSPKLPVRKTSQVSRNGAFRFRRKHCFLDAVNQ